MHRRELLVALAATIAGCGGSTAGGTSPTPRPTRTGTPSRTPMATPYPTATSTPEAVEAGTSRPTRSPEAPDETPAPTETEASTPTPVPKTVRLTDDARENIETALEMYAGFAGSGASVLGVGVTTTDFSRYGMNQRIKEAREHLGEAEKAATPEQTETIDALYDVATFVEKAGFTEIHLINAYAEFDAVYAEMYDGDWQEMNEDVDSMESHVSNAEDGLDALASATSSEDVRVVDGLSTDGYEGKIEQFRRDIGAFEAIVEQLSALRSALQSFDLAASRYQRGDYWRVEFDPDAFASVRDALQGTADRASIGPQFEELICVADALAGGAKAMRNATEARDDGKENTAVSYENDAREAFETCASVAEKLPPVVDLLESFE